MFPLSTWPGHYIDIRSTIIYALFQQNTYNVDVESSRAAQFRVRPVSSTHLPWLRTIRYIRFLLVLHYVAHVSLSLPTTS